MYVLLHNVPNTMLGLRICGFDRWEERVSIDSLLGWVFFSLRNIYMHKISELEMCGLWNKLPLDIELS